MKKPAALMFQGTGSDVGKSLIVAGLCRLFADRGLIVRPFKPQNMSNNAAVTVDGGEIGRAQALQARAARTLPTVDMNPVLLKPQSETGAQLIVNGRMRGAAGARDYQRIKASLLPDVLASFERLKTDADLVLVEGAGSASEINLRANDIANMGFARAAGVPVIIIGDIERGGVIASLVGTHAVLDPPDRATVAGFIVNRMRGDPSLFASGMATIATMTGWRPLGLVPYLPDAARLPAEDTLALTQKREPQAAGMSEGAAGAIRIAIPVLPHIANFDEFDPLAHDPRFALRFLKDGAPLPGDTDLVILAGAKATIADLDALKAAGWETDIAAHVRRGGHVLGICGGYQMLGRSIADPLGLEGPAREVAGLGLIDVATVLGGDKRLAEARGTFAGQTIPIAGYEMHVGTTTGPATAQPLIRLDDGRADGALSPSGRIGGTYLHGLFAGEPARDWLAARFGHAGRSSFSYDAALDAALDRLAAHLAVHLDIEALIRLAS